MSSEQTINRSKTPLSRNNFSRPVQHRLESALRTRKRSFFDYRGGRGDNIARLTELGFHAPPGIGDLVSGTG